MSWDTQLELPESISISASDSPSIDAFSRWRVSDPVTLFDNSQQYGDSTLVWETQLTGAGTKSNLYSESSVELSTGDLLAGNKVVRQTRQYHRYQPGKSQLVLLTFVMNGGKTNNLQRRYGYFDQNDGIFFELKDQTAKLTLRTSTSGAPSDLNSFDQLNWNIDRMDGNGISGIDLDFSKAQILVIDLQWLGVGRVRVGWDVDGKIYWCHYFLNANRLTSVYMKSANLPIRMEIESTGVLQNIGTMKHICTSVISEGGFEDQRGIEFSVLRPAASPITVTTRRPVISIRAKTTGPNGIRNIGQILFKELDIMVGTNSGTFELVLNPTTLTAGGVAPTWLDVDANFSITQYNLNADVIAGGIVINSGCIPAGAGSTRGITSGQSYRKFPLVYTGLLNVQDVLCVVATSVGGNCIVNANINFQEFY